MKALAPLLVVALSCGGQPQAKPPTQTAAASVAASEPSAKPAPISGDDRGDDAKPKTKNKKKIDPLFPVREPRGWDELKDDERAKVDSLANAYLSFISEAKTPRRAISRLVAIAENAGARAVKPGERGLTGIHYYVGNGGDSAVFVRSGSNQASAGANVIVVSVDAPRLILKTNAAEERHHHEMLQTQLHGELDLRSWMVHPLALDIWVEKGGKPIAFSIGERADDPVLSIPDLLPHLSRGSQKRGKEVDDAERLDALSGIKVGALAKMLRTKRLAAGDLANAEAALIPAGHATRIGADRGLIGGYGHGNRALAYASLWGLLKASPTQTAVVIVLGQTEITETGASTAARALRNAIAWTSKRELDVYDVRVALRRSSALVGLNLEADFNTGVVIDLIGADALPKAGVKLSALLDSSKVPFTFRPKGYSSTARKIASLDLDAIGLAIPTKGSGTPGELVSVLDLYYGANACRAWLSRSL